MPKIDRIFTNATFYTQDEHHPKASRVGVHQGRIFALDDDLDGFVASEVIDLAGAIVIPGLNDAHHHVSQQGERLQMVDVTPEACPTISDVLSSLQSAVTTRVDGWILANGYDQHRLGRYPTLAELDAVTGDKPLWMLQSSGHMGLTNSRGLELAGIDPLSPPTGIIGGGYVEADSDGRATGLLTEGAMTAVTQLIKPTVLEDWVRCIGIGSDDALRKGITSATETGIVGPALSGNGPDDIAAFQIAHERGLLGVRMTLFPEAATLISVDGSVAYGGMRTGFGDEWLRLGATKFFVDGSLLGQTAAVSEPFVTNGSYGDFARDPDEIFRDIIAAHAAGWQIAAHAIGDRAIDLLLDAIEEAHRLYPRHDARPLVEHAAITTDKNIRRMRSVGAIPVPQAHFIGAFGDGMRAALGDERVPLTYRQASFLRAGLVLPGSSDCPVTDGSPILGIHDLVNRTTIDGYVFAPDERLTIEEAVFAYTVGSAYSNHEEKIKGRLSPGFLADMTVLDRDIFAIEPAEIRDTEVLRTVVGGESAFVA